MNRNESTKKKITGKELSSQDEVNVKLDTLIELLVSKGILSRREFERMSTMRLHEISKARAFEDLDEEI
jgi:hypothetical protein